MPSPTLRDVSADQPPSRSVRKEVRAILADGGLVALPTETVYGVAARADRPEALERLRKLKGGREADQTFTWHVPNLAVLEHFPHLPTLVARIAERYWPGPLTLVLEGTPPGLEHVSREGWVGVRLPAHTATRAVLEFVDFPVVMTSANRSGEPAPIDAESVRAALDEEIGLLLDGGPCQVGQSSTVLQVGRGHFDVLREGLVTGDDLRSAAGLSIGFVCTGNTCRSPMAEGLARDLLSRHLGLAPGGRLGLADFGFEVLSAGVYAGVGSPASENAVQVMHSAGIDITAHRSRAAVPEMIQALDRVYCLTSSHLESLTLALPPRKARHVVLLDLKGRDVPDPIGGSVEEYRACAERIREGIVARLDEWA